MRGGENEEGRRTKRDTQERSERKGKGKVERKGCKEMGRGVKGFVVKEEKVKKN